MLKKLVKLKAMLADELDYFGWQPVVHLITTIIAILLWVAILFFPVHRWILFILSIIIWFIGFVIDLNRFRF